MPRLAYRAASGTDDSFTPRPGKDTLGPKRGLSTFETLDRVPDGRVHAIDLDLLGPPLQGIPNGGGHVSIVPVTASGEVDDEKLEEWAKYRMTGKRHPYTQMVLDARVGEDVKGEP